MTHKHDDLIDDLQTEDREGMRQYEREARIVLRGLLTKAADAIKELVVENEYLLNQYSDLADSVASHVLRAKKAEAECDQLREQVVEITEAHDKRGNHIEFELLPQMHDLSMENLELCKILKSVLDLDRSLGTRSTVHDIAEAALSRTNGEDQ